MESRSHEIIDKINSDRGLGLTFLDEKGDECVSVYSGDFLREVSCEITTFRGISFDAIHYYIRLHVSSLSQLNKTTGKVYWTAGSGDKLKPKGMLSMNIQVTRQLEAIDFQDDHKFDTYEIGDYTERFNTERSAIEKARSEFKRIFGTGWKLEKN